MRGKASFFGKDIQDLRELIARAGYGPPRPARSSRSTSPRLRRAHEEGLLLSSAFPFVVDAGNGSGGPLGLAALRAAGLSPDPLFCDMDGSFPNHHPDPTVPRTSTPSSAA